MNTGRFVLYAAVAGAAILFAVHRREGADAAGPDLGNRSNLYQTGTSDQSALHGQDGFHITSIGSWRISGCTAADTQLPTTATVQLHIPSTIFANLATHQSIVCPGGVGNSCAKDITGGNNQYLPVANFNSSKINWRTPLDVDLSSYFANTNALVQLQIVLDGAGLRFFQPLNNSSDWSQAVRQGTEGQGMFYCLQPPDPSKNKPLYVLVKYLAPTNPGDYTNGGLNIGILVPDPNNPNIALPIFIDPQIHNNG